MGTHDVDRASMQAKGNRQQVSGFRSMNMHMKWTRVSLKRAGFAVLVIVGGLTACGVEQSLSGATLSGPGSILTTTPRGMVEQVESRLMDSCRGPQQFGTVRCNDLRHFGSATTSPEKPDGMGIRQWECQQPQNYRTAGCNDLRHMEDR